MSEEKTESPAAETFDAVCKYCGGTGYYFRKNGFCPTTKEKCINCKGSGTVTIERICGNCDYHRGCPIFALDHDPKGYCDAWKVKK